VSDAEYLHTPTTAEADALEEMVEPGTVPAEARQQRT
jgi:hypothetical protein